MGIMLSGCLDLLYVHHSFDGDNGFFTSFGSNLDFITFMQESISECFESGELHVFTSMLRCYGDECLVRIDASELI